MLQSNFILSVFVFEIFYLKYLFQNKLKSLLIPFEIHLFCITGNAQPASAARLTTCNIFRHCALGESRMRSSGIAVLRTFFLFSAPSYYAF